MLRPQWRIFAMVLFVLGVSVSSARAEASPPMFPGSDWLLWETEQITDELYAFRYQFYRSIFLVTDEGVIASDPLNVEAGKILAQEIARVTDQPVKYVAYSHSHWDHIAGGQPFKDQGAKFVAQENCARNLRENPNPDVVPADITFDAFYEIKLGGASLELFYFGPSHDNCLVVMIANPANILFMIDLLNPPSGWIMFYNPTLADTYIYNVVPFLKQVEALVAERNIERIIGAHTQMDMVMGETGLQPVMVSGTIGSANAIKERRLLYQGAIDAVLAQLAAGTAPGDVPDILVERRLMADKIIGYDPEQMRILFKRLTIYGVTGE